MRTIATMATLGMAACGFNGGSTPSDAKIGDGSHVFLDAPADGVPDAIPIDARACFGTGTYSVCLTGGQLSMSPVTLTGTIDTGAAAAASMCLTVQPADWGAANQQAACFIVGTTITIASGTVRASGDRPLVLLATDTLTVTGTLDASSHIGAVGTGPFSNPGVDCPGVGETAPGASGNGGGGGGGGSFIGAGGNGGTGDNNNASLGTAASGVATPAVLRGGCSGTTGGDTGAVGGAGGGAVYLVAGNAIVLQNGSAINASGAGSAHGGSESGGGGGGAGGMIVLYAPAITGAQATLMANGGGASSGGGNGSAGNDGSDPNLATPMVAAPGGPNTVAGAAGGAGAGGGDPAQPGNSAGSNKGGGGGGGASGYIRANIAITGVTASPLVDVQ